MQILFLQLNHTINRKEYKLRFSLKLKCSKLLLKSKVEITKSNQIFYINTMNLYAWFKIKALKLQHNNKNESLPKNFLKFN